MALFLILPTSLQASEVFTDKLTVEDTGAVKTNYIDWTAERGEGHPTITSGAVYAGNSAKGNGNGGIQLRSKGQSGIITTGSGGRARKVTVAWVNTYQNDDRYLAVYGINTSYTSVSNLYTEGMRGDLLATFSYNESSFSQEDDVYYSEIEITDDYRYIGLRSSSGALYLASVSIDWEVSGASRVWDWAEDYNSATCTFTDDSGTHTEEATVTSEVTKEPTYIEDGVLTYTAAVTYDGVLYRDLQTEPIPHLVFPGTVPYIDANKTPQDSPAGTQLITGSESELTSGWYAAASDTYVNNIQIKGDVKIILCDGVTISGATTAFHVSGSSDKLTFYGQEKDSGALGNSKSYTTADGKGTIIVYGGSFINCVLSCENAITVNGGKIDSRSDNAGLYCRNGTVTFNGGEFYSSSSPGVYCQKFVYNGGKFRADNSRTGIDCPGKDVTLNWTSEDDSFNASQIGYWLLTDIYNNTYIFDTMDVTLKKDFIDKNGKRYPAGKNNSHDLWYTTLYPAVDKWQSLQNKIDASSSGDVITLKSDIVAGVDNTALVVPTGKEVLTIDLNGYKLDRGLANKDAVEGGNVITNHAAELHIIDTSDNKSGRITGGNNLGNGGGIFTDTDTLELDGVTVSGNRCSGSGGGICASFAIVLHDCKVENNVADVNGGGIFCSRNNVNNKVLISGLVKVTGNTKSDGSANNVYFPGSQNFIYPTDQLSSDTLLGIRTSVSDKRITDGLRGKGTAENFFSDDKNYAVYLTNSGEARLARSFVLHFDANGGSGEMEDISTLDSTVTMPTCTFTPPEGMRFKAWSDGYGNDNIQEDEEVNLSNTAYEYTIYAVWAKLYTITVENAKHGTVLANKDEAIAGERVRLEATPDEGYRLDHFVVTDGDGKRVNVYNSSYFLMPESNVTVSAEFIKAQLFAAHSLSLDGDIGVNFYLSLTEQEIADGAEVAFAWTVDGKQKTRDICLTAKDKTSNGYRAKCPVAVAEMTYEITATLTLGGTVAATNTYSAATYANVILNDTDFRTQFLEEANAEQYDKLVLLVKAMLDYGTKAQLRFGRNTENLANGGTDFFSEEVTIPNAAGKMDENLSDCGLEYVGSTVVYLTKTTLRHYYKIMDPSRFTEDIQNGITFDGETVTYGEKNGMIYFDKADIAAPELDTEYVLSINGHEYHYAALDYSSLAYASDTRPYDESITKQLAAAVYRYNQAADAFFDKEGA